jgi:hypothetical protein
MTAEIPRWRGLTLRNLLTALAMRLAKLSMVIVFRSEVWSLVMIWVLQSL